MSADRLEDRAELLRAHYRDVSERVMAGLPLVNPRLGVASTAFVERAGWAYGIMVTPWFMNVLAFAAPDNEGRGAGGLAGSTVTRNLPAGDVEFIVGEIEGFGRVDGCSLFSPMDEFADMQAAIEVAELSMAGLFEEPDAEPVRAEPAPPLLSRRALFGGFRHAREGSP